MKPMPHGGTAFIWVAVSLTLSLVKAQQCVEGQYWCQNRCGTDADTCCDTPDGQHNLCGPDTICCGFGCCPDSSYKCNADFSCTGPDGVVIPPAQPSHPIPTITTGGGDDGGSPAPTPKGTVVIIETQTVTPPAVTTLTTVTTLDHTITLTPPENTDPAQPPSTVVIVGTNTATLPPITEPTTIVTIGTTLTLMPPTSPPPTNTDGPGQGPVTGGPVTPIVVIDGTKTVTFPPVTTPRTVTTDDQTFTLVPNGPPTMTVGKPPPVTTNTGGPAQGPNPPVVVIDGTKTATFPPVTTRTTVATDGQTFTLVPDGPPTITVGKPPPPTTQTSNPPVVVNIGSESITFPPVTQQTTVTTEGQTFTLEPQGPPTIIVSPPPSPSPPSAQTTGTTTQTQTEGTLPTFTEWPPEASIIPVNQEVEEPKPEDDDGDEDPDGAVVPCNLWFFSICIKFPSIDIRSWKFNFPPGIYPPGPPPFPNFKLPPGFSFQDDLPPWPPLTVGSDHVPTFSEQPDPTNCETKTASLCFETTSFIVSTVDGAVQTVSSTVAPPECGEVRGCAVLDATQTASITKTDECETATVTDVVVTCSGNEATACSTKTEIPKTGCSVTPTTTTESCIPAPTDANARRQEGDNFCPLAVPYLVWPRDSTKTDETDAIYAKIQKLLPEESKIEVFGTETLGVDYWEVALEPGQVEKVEKISNVAAVYQPCTDCWDPSTDTNWRYQVKYMDEPLKNTKNQDVTGRDQMIYLSKNQQSRKESKDRYFFDVSAGEDIPVYIVDTGAQMDNPEFDYIRGKTEFIFIGDDHDGNRTKDDSGAPLDGKCIQGKQCNPHGTGMLSLVAGKRVGITKKVKPYVVRMPRHKDSGGVASAEEYLRGVAEVDDAVKGPSNTVRAILNLSWHYPWEGFKYNKPHVTKNDYEVWQKDLYRHITSLISKGVFVVTGAGNGDAKGYPAFFGASGDPLEIPEILVVGAAYAGTGKPGETSFREPTVNLPHIYAPGVDIIAAEGDKAKWTRKNLFRKMTYKVSAGTSDASAYTAGLAAYFVKLHQLGRLPKDAKGNDPDMSPAGLKRYILNNGWSRYSEKHVGDIVGIWNGATREQHNQACPYNLKKGMKKLKVRQEEDANDVDYDDDDDDDIPATATCGLGESPTGSPTTTDNPISEPSLTGLTCTPETADQCALICSAPRRNGCEDGKCVCLLPEQTTLSTVTRTTEESNPTGLTCTPETADQCAPALICGGPRRNGCQDGKCVCLLPDPSTSTTTEPPEPPAPTCDDKCKLDAGNPCNCDDNGCDEQSPSCCSTSNCPQCECGKSGCSDGSPACCANDTCQWLDGGDGQSPEDPEPNKGFVLFAFEELYTPNPMGPATWDRRWLVFSTSSDGEGVDVCNDDSVESETSTDGFGNDHGFPPSIGPFEAKGTTCSYEGDEVKPGTLVCDGVRRECEKYDEDSVSCGLGNPTIHKVVGCYF